jgi:uncharacterized protein (UPF0332 family)
VSLHSDLIEQAEHLAKREPKKPRQASLRRAVSAAYYALFHMLIDDGALKLIPNEPISLRAQAQRAFAHGEMKKTCEQFGKSAVFSHLLALPVEAELTRVAAAFVDLQQQRHAADYDLSQTFDQLRVSLIIDQAKKATLDWRAVRHTPNANVFLVALLLGTRWNR